MGLENNEQVKIAWLRCTPQFYTIPIDSFDESLID